MLPAGRRIGRRLPRSRVVSVKAHYWDRDGAGDKDNNSEYNRPPKRSVYASNTLGQLRAASDAGFQHPESPASRRKASLFERMVALLEIQNIKEALETGLFIGNFSDAKAAILAACEVWGRGSPEGETLKKEVMDVFKKRHIEDLRRDIDHAQNALDWLAKKNRYQKVVRSYGCKDADKMLQVEEQLIKSVEGSRIRNNLANSASPLQTEHYLSSVDVVAKAFNMKTKDLLSDEELALRRRITNIYDFWRKRDAFKSRSAALGLQQHYLDELDLIAKKADMPSLSGDLRRSYRTAAVLREMQMLKENAKKSSCPDELNRYVGLIQNLAKKEGDLLPASEEYIRGLYEDHGREIYEKLKTAKLPVLVKKLTVWLKQLNRDVANVFPVSETELKTRNFLADLAAAANEVEQLRHWEGDIEAFESRYEALCAERLLNGGGAPFSDLEGQLLRYKVLRRDVNRILATIDRLGSNSAAVKSCYDKLAVLEKQYGIDISRHPDE